MKSYNYPAESPCSCCCDDKTCEGIGYCHTGMFSLPMDTENAKKAMKAMRMHPDNQKNILKRIEKGSTPRIAPWHIHPRDRRIGPDGRYRIVERSVYKDEEKVEYSFPPPNYHPADFVAYEVKSRTNGYRRGVDDGSDEALPRWVKDMAKAQAREASSASSAPSASVGAAVTPSPKKSRKISHVAAKKRRADVNLDEDKDEQIRLLKAQLESALFELEGVKVELEIQKDKSLQIKLERDQLREEVERLRGVLEELKQAKVVLSFDDLKPEGALGDYVKDFTFFDSYETNVAFLDMINAADTLGEGNGLCENLPRYSKVSWEERQKCNKELKKYRAGKGSGGNGCEENKENEAEPRTKDHLPTADTVEENDGECDDTVFVPIDEAEEDGTTAIPSAFNAAPSSRRKVSYRTEWLVYCIYTHSGWTQRQIAALFGIGPTLVSDIVYAWANLLDQVLRRFFPAPTRSQMLRAYPVSVLRKFSSVAIIYMLLDATEIRADVASMKNMNAALFSAYKHSSTAKWLVGSDVIGTTWWDSIPDASPGAASDPVMVAITRILEQIPAGMAVEVDKGFIIDNACAELGIICIRPVKKQKGQTQQSKADTALTQKVGKTRIPIEQANGQMKRSTRYFNGSIPLLQLGLANLIFRVSYLLQNFKVGFIQERHPDGPPAVGRPSKAEIRWYGATDEGLVDIRPDVAIWGTDKEIARWKELRNLEENNDLTNTDISEIVLAEDWPSKLRKELENL